MWSATEQCCRLQPPPRSKLSGVVICWLLLRLFLCLHPSFAYARSVCMTALINLPSDRQKSANRPDETLTTTLMYLSNLNTFNGVLQASVFNHLIGIKKPFSLKILSRWDMVWLCIHYVVQETKHPNPRPWSLNTFFLRANHTGMHKHITHTCTDTHTYTRAHARTRCTDSADGFHLLLSVASNAAPLVFLVWAAVRTLIS